MREFRSIRSFEVLNLWDQVAFYTIKMFAPLAYLLVALLSYLLFYVTYRRRNSAFATFPTLKKHFMVHNIFSVLPLTLENLLVKMSKWQTKLGEVFLITVHPFHCGIAFVNDPVIAEAVSLHQPDRSRTLVYSTLAPWIGDGFFLSPLEKSKKLLKPLWVAFNAKNHPRVSEIEGQIFFNKEKLL